MPDDHKADSGVGYAPPQYVILRVQRPPVNTDATDAYPSATFITGRTDASKYHPADSRTAALCILPRQLRSRPAPLLRTCPVIVYNPSYNPLFHSHPYAAQYSARYAAADAPLNLGHAYAAPDVVESRTMLPLPLYTRWWCILRQPVP